LHKREIEFGVFQWAMSSIRRKANVW